jgi:two-component system, chemotaxis family, sensor kinase Cph1
MIYLDVRKELLVKYIYIESAIIIALATAFIMAMLFEANSGYYLLSIFTLFLYISFLKIREKHWINLARYDEQTGLLNRRSIMHVYTYELNRATRYTTELTIFLLDLDNLKEINDHKGHIEGDKAIKIVSDICQGMLRQSDFIGRYGGDEFFGILPMSDQASVKCVLRRIKNAVSDYEVAGIPLSISIGAATLKKGDTESILFNRADEALYKVKNGGRNGLHIVH